MGKLENILGFHSYIQMEGQLEHVFEEKDLGIIIDTYLTFDVHVSENDQDGQQHAWLIVWSMLSVHLSGAP